MSDYGVLLAAIVLLVLGYVLEVGILITLGWIALVIGAILLILGLAGRSPFKSRRRL